MKLTPYLLIVLLASCSLFVGSTESIIIEATDADAEISVDGRNMGPGPISVDLLRNKSHSFIARVDDRAGTATLNYSLSKTGVLDIIGGVLIILPFLGVFGNGFWSLDADRVIIPVPPKSSGG